MTGSLRSISLRLDDSDIDLGSGGVVLLPDQPSGIPHLLVTGGKEGKLYLINRDSMGHYCATCTAATGDTNTVQSFDATTGFFDTPAFWQGGLYISGPSDKLIVFPLQSHVRHIQHYPFFTIGDDIPVSWIDAVDFFPGCVEWNRLGHRFQPVRHSS